LENFVETNFANEFSKGGIMKDFLSCCFVSMLVGATVGAVIVSKNKQISEFVRKGTNVVEDKVEDITKQIEKATKGNK